MDGQHEIIVSDGNIVAHVGPRPSGSRIGRSWDREVWGIAKEVDRHHFAVQAQSISSGYSEWDGER
jgi:hypothetical protein